jgi:hypothetical protein
MWPFPASSNRRTARSACSRWSSRSPECSECEIRPEVDVIKVVFEVPGLLLQPLANQIKVGIGIKEALMLLYVHLFLL